jgi:hypothetical protein
MGIPLLFIGAFGFLGGGYIGARIGAAMSAIRSFFVLMVAIAAGLASIWLGEALTLMFLGKIETPWENCILWPTALTGFWVGTRAGNWLWGRMPKRLAPPISAFTCKKENENAV